MLSILVIQKEGTIKPVSIKVKDFHIDELYRKCGFKTMIHFQQQMEWMHPEGMFKVCLYGKAVGKSNVENKYEFPHDTTYFGSCALVAFQQRQTKKGKEGEEEEETGQKDNGEQEIKEDDKEEEDNELWQPISLTEEMWIPFHHELMKNAVIHLDTTRKTDEEEKDELNLLPKKRKTTIGGYKKTKFVVEEEEETVVDIGFELTEEPYSY